MKTERITSYVFELLMMFIMKFNPIIIVIPLDAIAVQEMFKRTCQNLILCRHTQTAEIAKTFEALCTERE